MAGAQSLDRMGGFRKAIPFTFITFLVGGLALAGLPPFSGWLSKDDIIGFLDHRGGGFEVLGIAGYVGALLTAIYTFRMIFRAFFGEPVEEARELERGHLAHADVPRNPMTGEEEDSDVGFPGPAHYIAEREWPMKIAMGTLALLAVIGGVVQIPGVDDAVVRFLDPAFAGSSLAHVQGRTGWRGARGFGGGAPRADGVPALLRRRDDRLPGGGCPLLPDLELVDAALDPHLAAAGDLAAGAAGAAAAGRLDHGGRQPNHA